MRVDSYSYSRAHLLSRFLAHAFSFPLSPLPFWVSNSPRLPKCSHTAAQVEQEVRTLSDEVVRVIETQLLPATFNNDDTTLVFYHKTVGDWLRYAGECCTDTQEASKLHDRAKEVHAPA